LPADIFLLVLGAAFLHAAWNALVKAASDRLLVLSSVAMGQSLAGALLIPFVSPPDPSSWPAIGLSTLFHYLYYACLLQAYRFGDLSLVYPIARGLSPVLVAAGAAVFWGEVLPPVALAGVMLASLGIGAIALTRGASGRFETPGLLFAGATGVIIAGYTVSDGIGVRLSASPLGYIAWLFIFEIPVVVFALLRRRGRLVASLGSQWRHAAGTALSSSLAYALVIYAAKFAPMAAVSALRESSVIMAALIGAVFFKERPWRARIAAAALVAGGVSMITLSR
jgi:uncharacterized membrane protein